MASMSSRALRGIRSLRNRSRIVLPPLTGTGTDDTGTGSSTGTSTGTGTGTSPPPGPPSPPVVPPSPPAPTGVPDFTTPLYGYRFGNQAPYSPDPSYISMGSSRGPHGWHVARGEIYLVPNPRSGGIVRFELQEPVMSPNINDWPILRPIGTIGNPWNAYEGITNNYFVGDVPKQTYINDLWYGNLTGSGNKMWASFRVLYEPTLDYSEPMRAWSLDDDEYYDWPGGRRHGQGCGFIKRFDHTNTRMGVIGSYTNAGIAGCSVIDRDGTALLLPEDWGGVPGQTINSWNSRCFIPPKCWLLGFTFPTDVASLQYTVPSNLYESAGHLYNWPLIPSAGAPADATETAMQQACLSDPGNASLVEVLAAQIEGDRPEKAALLRKWGFWCQKWGCDQAYGSGLWIPDVGVLYAVNCGLGDQSYEYQHFHIRPPGTSMVVSYALSKVTRFALYPFNLDGSINPQPEWIDAPYIPGVGGLSYTPDGKPSLSILNAFADYDVTFNLNAENPAVAVYAP